MKKYSEGKDYRVIAYCISRFHRDEQSENIYYFQRLCSQYKCKAIVFSTLTDLYYDDMNDHGEKQIYSVFDITAFDAVVIMSETFKKVRIDRIIADRAISAGIPVISVNRRLEGCINIDFTYAQTFKMLVKHIVEDHGCRKVNYIGGDRDSKFSRERFESYRSVLEENGIPFEKKRCGYGNFVGNAAVEVLNEFLKDEDLPEAIICANDTMAMDVCTRLKEVGLRVPEDIKVTGFDGIEFEKYHNPRLTTAAYVWEETTRTIFETLADIWKGEKVQELIMVPYKLQIGHSCGCENNQVMNPADKILELQDIHSSSSEYYQTMLNMNAESDSCDEFEQLLPIVEKFAGQIYYKEYWVCFNTFCYESMVNRIPEDMDELLTRVKRSEEKVYSKQMVAAYHSIAGSAKNSSNKPEIIERNELLPDLDDILEKEDMVMFLPMHLRGITIGYIAFTFEDKKFRPDLLNIFIMHFRNDIEGFWSRVIKEQLFSKDELTGLYNRRGFERQKQKMFYGDKSCDNFTLISLDMDNLKKINDLYGHGEGDIALKQVGKIIDSVSERGEICARMGGDEFLIATANPRGKERAIEIQNAIHTKLGEYNLISGKPYELWVSIGFFTGEKVEKIDYEVFASQADKEMYQDKQRHKRGKEAYNR